MSAYFSVKIQFSDTMAEFAFVKAECEAVDVKEECLEQEDPLTIASNSETGYCICISYLGAKKVICE